MLCKAEEEKGTPTCPTYQCIHLLHLSWMSQGISFNGLKKCNSCKAFGDSITNSSQVSVLSSCQFSFTRNDLTELKLIWEALTPERRFIFSKKYEHIAELMYILVNYFALTAIIHIWDPTYGCFKFR